jgi:hypothetical protein
MRKAKKELEPKTASFFGPILFVGYNITLNFELSFLSFHLQFFWSFRLVFRILRPH